MNLFGKYFKLSFLFVSLTLILSFAAYFYPFFNKVAFFVILALILILTLEKLEYGLYILLAELFIGSKGYLFYFDLGGVSVSLRIALFLVVMGAWLYKRLKILDFRLKIDKWWWILFAFIGWGLVWGLIRGNNFQNVFFDFNAWLYFGLIFIFMDTIKSREQIENAMQIFTAAVSIIILKTLFFIYIFSHGIEAAIFPIYRWLRQFLIGEITLTPSGFYRIFFQSQIYVLIGLFIFIALLIWRQKFPLRPPFSKGELEENFISHWLLVIGSLSSILVSFSRSFWVGFAFGVLVLLISLFISKFPFKMIFKIILVGLLTVSASAALIWIIMRFPYPTPSQISFGSMFGERMDFGEAAVRSRWDLLPPLGRAIAKHPIIGSGFGTTITYKSSDPRALEVNPTGEFTTYAFEWGYLDIILKIGLAGLAAYLILIGKILRQGWQILKFPISNFQFSITLGMFLGLAAFLATNFFSPYLNHPLGIGYIMMCGVIFAKSEQITGDTPSSEGG